MPPDSVSLNKASIIERALRRVREEYAANPQLDNWTHIDALTLNLERACQAAIDLAMHRVSSGRLGMPQSSGEAFTLLADAGLIPPALAERLRAMTGFRNIAVHQYQKLDLAILRRIAESSAPDLATFCHHLGLKIVTA